VDREKVEVTADGKSGSVNLTTRADIASDKFVVESEYIEVGESVSFGKKIPTDGLIAEYTFFEGAGAVLHDTSGNNSNANIYGAQWVKLPTGKIVLKYDGVDDYCIAESQVFDFSKYDEFTILVWVLRDKKGHGGVAGYQPGGFIEGRSPSMWIYPDEKGFHFGFGDGSKFYGISRMNVLEMNKWFLLGIRWRYSDSRLEGLVNTKYVGEVDTKGSRPYSNAHYTIGRVGGTYHAGLIGCAYIYKKYLSDKKIEKIYKTTAPIFGIEV